MHLHGDYCSRHKNTEQKQQKQKEQRAIFYVRVAGKMIMDAWMDGLGRAAEERELILASLSPPSTSFFFVAQRKRTCLVTTGGSMEICMVMWDGDVFGVFSRTERVCIFKGSGILFLLVRRLSIDVGI